MAAESRYAVGTQLNTMAFIAMSRPIDGRAIFTEVPAKGVKNEAAVVTARAVRLLSGGFIFLTVLYEKNIFSPWRFFNAGRRSYRVL
jgi:hypothetical protein